MDMLYNVKDVAMQEQNYVSTVLDRSTWNTQNAFVGNKYTDTTIIRGLQRMEQPARLRAAREALGLTQAQFAEMLGVPPTTYASIEQGQNGVGFELAGALERSQGVALEWWMGTVTPKEAALLGLERGLKGVPVEPALQAHEVKLSSRHARQRRHKE